jgi:Fe-S-cluster containining protein
LLKTIEPIQPPVTDTLCTRCGLCCDGALFANVVPVSRAGGRRFDSMGLEILDNVTNVGLLSQPCAALDGTRCSIYEKRPAICRTFACQLLQDVENGDVPLARARELVTDTQKRIRRLRELLAEAGQRDVRLPLKQRCKRAIAALAGESGDAKRTRSELNSAMSAIDEIIWQNFLGSGSSSGNPDRR